jgi:ABC-2 type transport system ATP-binding protein
MGEAIISVRDLSVRFGDFTAVNRVHFEVSKAEIFGYLGANGAGKSTTIKVLCGLLRPTSGEALIAGIDVRRYPEQVKARIGYMSQKFSLYSDLTVRENLTFFGGIHGFGGTELRRRIDATLEEIEMCDHAGELTAELPGGWLQRVALGNALLHGPEVLFLDEPTAGVDPASRRHFMAIVRRRVASGVTVFLTTHYLDEAEYCERIGLMVQGRLVALDSPEALKAKFVPDRNDPTLDEVFQNVVRLETRP